MLNGVHYNYTIDKERTEPHMSVSQKLRLHISIANGTCDLFTDRDKEQHPFLSVV